MTLSYYGGTCFRCGKKVEPGKGDFQHKRTLPKKIRNNLFGRWVVRCFSCKKMGNKPIEGSGFYDKEEELINEAKRLTEHND